MSVEPRLFALLVGSIRQPRAVAAELFTLNPTNSVRWMGLALVATLSAILSVLVLMWVPDGARVPGAALFASPLRAASVTLAMLIVFAFLMQFFGSLFGGAGTFRDALLVTVWLQFVLVCMQLCQFLTLLAVPAVASLTGGMLIALMLWMLTQFVAELHGFSSAFKVFAGIVAGFFLTVVALSLVMVMLGLTPPVEA